MLGFITSISLCTSVKTYIYLILCLISLISHVIITRKKSFTTDEKSNSIQTEVSKTNDVAAVTNETIDENVIKTNVVEKPFKITDINENIEYIDVE